MYAVVFLVFLIIFLSLTLYYAYDETCRRSVYMDNTSRSLDSIAHSLKEISGDLKSHRVESH